MDLDCIVNYVDFEVSNFVEINLVPISIFLFDVLFVFGSCLRVRIGLRLEWLR